MRLCRLGLLILFFTTPSLAACSKSSGSAGGPDAAVDTRPPTPPEWDRAVTRADDATATAGRAACKFTRGAMPAETLGSTTPLDRDIPIENVVVLMMENRSFDHYFGHLNKYAGRTDVESAPETASNPDRIGPDGGAAHPWQHGPHLCAVDTTHSWKGSHTQYDDGQMDGFFQTNDGDTSQTDPVLKSGERALWWYDERDLPFYYKLASTFAIADHYHAGLLGPTWPNRMYLIAATSFGRTSNDLANTSGYSFPDKDLSVLDELEKRHVDWTLFTDGGPGAIIVHGPALITRWGRTPNAPMRDFYARAAAGTLPAVSFVDPNYIDDGPSGQDEHPPADVQVGQKFVSDVVHALFASPQWKTSALFLTYDEHGGYFDHVPPPAACPPDGLTPIDSKGQPAPGAFDRHGVRVPLVVVSPWAKKGYAGHTTYDHTSITRFIEAKFKLPALTARDANADPMMDLFDFTQPAGSPPPDIPAPTVEPNELAYCIAQLSKK